MSSTKSYILITGVSTGIGYGLAKEFLNRGHIVYGSVRKEKDAINLQKDLGPSFRPLIMDVTSDEEVKNAFLTVNESISDTGLACLINNAGIAEGGPLQYQSQEDFEKHFEVNVFGLMRITRTFLPLLGATEGTTIRPGKIINISSVAGKVASPFVGAYVGTKHAVEGISHSLRRELLIYGIDVIIIGPGSVDTPIWDKGIKLEKYKNTAYGNVLETFGKAAKEGGESGLSIEYIAKNVANVFEKKNPNVRYAYVGDRLTRWTIPRLLPARMLDKIIKKKLGC